MAAPYGLPRAHFSYSFAAVRVLFANVALSNYGSDGSVEFEYPSQLMESELSADGYVTYVANNDERVRCTITLSEMSGALPILQAVVLAQQSAVRLGLAIPTTPFSMVDPATGDSVTSEVAVIVSSPPPSKSKTLGTREYVVELPYARALVFLGMNNAQTI